MKNIKVFDENDINNIPTNMGKIRWTFLEKIVPELNQFIRDKWVEYQLPLNQEELHQLEQKLLNNGTK